MVEETPSFFHYNNEQQQLLLMNNRRKVPLAQQKGWRLFFNNCRFQDNLLPLQA